MGAADPADPVEDHPALPPDAVDSRVLLARVYAAFPERIASATVRRPTLDDVFAARTGAAFTPDAAPELAPR